MSEISATEFENKPFDAKKAKAERDLKLDEYMRNRAAELKEKSETEKSERLKKENPEWYQNYLKKINEEGVDFLNLVRRFSSMKIEDISKEIGGNVEDLGYDKLRTLFSEGSMDEQMAEILRAKRGVYFKDHQLQTEAPEGIIAYDGRVIPMKDWLSATDSEKRSILVGSTCFHYNSDTPGMDSTPKDRW